MAYVSNYVHCVWGTWKRFPYFNERNRADVFWHMLSNAREKNIWIDQINGYEDHVHCLISLQPGQSLSQVVQLIKGESSHWINRHIHLTQDFRWAHEYYAISVGIDLLPVVRKYIANQESHHANLTWEQEERRYQKMIDKLLAPYRIDR